MRLIDADAFNDWILSHFAEPQSALILTLQGFIAEQPTAYDIDKVVEELEELRKKDVCDYLYCDVCAYTDKCSGVTDQSNNLKWDKAIEIVKQGGVDDDLCEWTQSGDMATNPHTFSKYKIKQCDGLYALSTCPHCRKKIKAVN